MAKFLIQVSCCGKTTYFGWAPDSWQEAESPNPAELRGLEEWEAELAMKNAAEFCRGGQL